MNKQINKNIIQNYIYDSQPLQTEEFYNILLKYSEWIPCLNKAETFQTNQLLKEVLAFHIKNGGKAERNIKAIFRAINKLKESHPDILKQIKKGWYIFNSKSKKNKKIIPAKLIISKKQGVVQPIAQKIYGKGEWFIYVLYDRKNTCKIGKTNNPALRFKTYASGLSIMPEYILEIRLENKQSMNLYEKTIHNILKLKKLEIQDKNKGGSEFFKIKPIEIKKIIEILNKLIL